VLHRAGDLRRLRSAGRHGLPACIRSGARNRLRVASGDDDI